LSSCEALFSPQRIPIFFSPGISRFHRGNLPKVITIAKTIQETLQSIVKCFESGAIKACLKVMGDVDGVLKLILGDQKSSK
jgi:hypothetical protein